MKGREDKQETQKQLGCMNRIFQLFDRRYLLGQRRNGNHQKKPPQEDKQEMKKQLGCMNGIFPLFDRRYLLRQRPNGHHQKKPPQGQNDNGKEINSASEKPKEKLAKENHRVSVESSRKSYSSCSSLECSKGVQTGQSSLCPSVFSKSSSPTSHTNPDFSTPPSDIKNVVKDSMTTNVNDESQVHEPGSNKRPPSSVVARLMGLEVLKNEPTDESNSLVRKPVSPKAPNVSTRIPLEPALWKQEVKKTDGGCKSDGQIERRLIEVEFKTSGKDLRAHHNKSVQPVSSIIKGTAIKPTTDSMVIKNLEKVKKVNPSIIKGTAIKPTTDPMVIKNLEKVKKVNPGKKSARNVASTETNANNRNRKPVSPSQAPEYMAQETYCNSRNSPIVSPRLRRSKSGVDKQNIHVIRKKQNSKSRSINTVQTNCNSKNSPTVSPRQQWSKSGIDKQNIHVIRKQQNSKSRSINTVQTNCYSRNSPTVSPRQQRSKSGTGKQNIHVTRKQQNSKSRSINTVKANDQSCRNSCHIRNLSQQSDTISFPSKSDASVGSQNEPEVTSSDGTQENKNKFAERLPGYKPMTELAIRTMEQPSRVSVLDAFCVEETLSPIRKRSYAFNDDEDLCIEERESSQVGIDSLVSNRKPNQPTSEFNQIKLDNIKHLVHQFELSNSTDDEATINPLEGINGDHTYIKEILLASGLLKNLDSVIQIIHLQPTGSLINPELFNMLEKTKERTSKSEKIRRKMIFDTINDMVVQKLARAASSGQWTSKRKARTLNAEKFLEELCLEINNLETNTVSADNDIINIATEDASNKSEDWKDNCSEVPALALDIERLIFEDLISEIVNA